MYDELVDVLVRALAWVVAISVGVVWCVIFLRLLVPQLNLLIVSFAATPGGVIVLVLVWRALGRPVRSRRDR
jgi:hypothetical protein